MNNDFLKNMVESQKNMMAMWQDMYKNMAHTNDDPYTKELYEFFLQLHATNLQLWRDAISFYGHESMERNAKINE